jgi:hypothetical protein
MRVKNLYREATNLKTAQFTGWDSIKCYVIQTTNTWDASITVTPSSLTSTTIVVKYTADYQDAPFAKLVADVSLDGNTESYRKTAPGTPPYVSILDNTSGRTFFSTTPRKSNELFWNINISTSTESNVKVKIKVFATQPGRLTAGVQNSNSYTGTLFIQ